MVERDHRRFFTRFGGKHAKAAAVLALPYSVARTKPALLSDTILETVCCLVTSNQQRCRITSSSRDRNDADPVSSIDSRAGFRRVRLSVEAGADKHILTCFM